MDFLGHKTQKLLKETQTLLNQTQESINKDIRELQDKQISTDTRLKRLEKQQDESAQTIGKLQQSLDDIRNSAIRGEIASGQKTKDVANKFNMSSARISQIAPRRKYSNG